MNWPDGRAAEALDLGTPRRVLHVVERDASAAQLAAGVLGRQHRERAEARERQVRERERRAGQVAPTVGEQPVHFVERFVRALERALRPAPV